MRTLVKGSTKPVVLGSYLGYWLDRSPRRTLHYLSYYRFAADLIGRPKSVLDVGCSEGLGTWLLASACGSAHGVDLDGPAVALARENWTAPNVSFEEGDFLQSRVERRYDAVTNFDVIEHILPKNADRFLAGLARRLTDDGVAVIGTPNIESDRWASKVTRAGHVNLYSAKRLEKEALRRFRNVFLFSANDELVHTGFAGMAHYLVAVACGPRR